MSEQRLIERLRTSLEPGGEVPLSTQLVEEIWSEVADGVLLAGERLPTVREMAIGLGTTPRNIERALAELDRLGVTATRPGEGTFVGLAPPPEEERRRRTALTTLLSSAVQEGARLGFSLDEMVSALAEFRDGAESPASPPQRSTGER